MDGNFILLVDGSKSPFGTHHGLGFNKKNQQNGVLRTDRFQALTVCMTSGLRSSGCRRMPLNWLNMDLMTFSNDVGSHVRAPEGKTTTNAWKVLIFLPGPCLLISWLDFVRALCLKTLFALVSILFLLSRLASEGRRKTLFVIRIRK